MNTKRNLLRFVDAIQLYVPDLNEGRKYYCEGMGLKLIWKTKTAIGLGFSEDRTELVLQNERDTIEVDFKVDSAEEAIEEIQRLGGTVIYGPFDIRIGKCAAIKDPWNNQYVILDSSKGTFITDGDGNIIGQKREGTV